MKTRVFTDQLRIIIFEQAPLIEYSKIADLLRNNNEEDIVLLKEKFIPTLSKPVIFKNTV